MIFFLKDKLVKLSDNNVIIKTHIKSLGIINENTDPIRIINDFSSNLVNQTKERKSFDQMIIDIKFKDYERLRNAKDYAINEGSINRTHFDMVKAKLRIGDDKFKGNLRLKGFYIEHLATDKWSLRVKISNDNVDGIRDFSLNAPFTKDFQSSPLINMAMRQRGILAPRDNFYDVILNGNDLGIMYFEERYSEQFTESSLRPFGPILTYDKKSERMSFLDDKKFWSDDRNLEFVFSNIEKIQSNPEDYYELFDKNLWAEYLAITLLFKCFNGNADLNLSYYFHPIKKVIQPVSSDNACLSKDANRFLGFLPLEDELIFKLIAIEPFKVLLKEKINWWIKSPKAKEYISELNKEGELIRRALSKDSPFLRRFFINNHHLNQVIEWIDSINTSSTKSSEEVSEFESKIIPNTIPVIELQKTDSGFNFQVNNYLSERFKLKSLLIESQDYIETVDLENMSDFSELNHWINNKFRVPESLQDPNIEYSFTDMNRPGDLLTLDVELSFRRSVDKPFEDSNISQLIPYFTLDEDKKMLVLNKGQSIIIDKLLILPAGYDFKMMKGSSMRFSRNAGIIVRGNFNVMGTEFEKVKISGLNDQDWAGVLILANNGDVDINNLIVSGGSGIFNGYKHRGAFTINQANVVISNSVFQNNISEDTLNLVEVRGSLQGVTIQDTPSDGLDIDYGEVFISDSVFQNIGKATGADAIDMSKSKVTIEGISIRNTTDKGISIGEGSIAKIKDSYISSAFVGLVAKDSSDVYADNLKLEDIIFADTMSYRKKPHFDGAKLRIDNLSTVLGNHIVQNKSSALINGNKIKSEKVDIDALYDDLMLSVK